MSFKYVLMYYMYIYMLYNVMCFMNLKCVKESLNYIYIGNLESLRKILKH